jgi:hypothetical protein
MDEFYWKKRSIYYGADLYVSPEGRVCGELSDSKSDNTWSTKVWSQSERHFISLGVFINEETAKAAIEEYCGDNY